MDKLQPLAYLSPVFPPRDCLRPALFLDRDDTLIWNVPYLSDPEQVRLIPGAAESLKLFRDAGWRLILVSNQSGLGRGYFTQAQLEAVQARVYEVLALEGVQLDGSYCCPHAPEMRCACRKPMTGMLEAAFRDFLIDHPRSVMVGDKRDDVLCGRQAGVHPIQLSVKGLPGAAEAELVAGTWAEVAHWASVEK